MDIAVRKYCSVSEVARTITESHQEKLAAYETRRRVLLDCKSTLPARLRPPKSKEDILDRGGNRWCRLGATAFPSLKTQHKPELGIWCWGCSKLSNYCMVEKNENFKHSWLDDLPDKIAEEIDTTILPGARGKGAVMMILAKHAERA